jgi:hypothetical protein
MRPFFALRALVQLRLKRNELFESDGACLKSVAKFYQSPSNITVFKPKNCNRSPREREAEAKATKLTNTTKAIIVLVLCLA